MPATLSAPEAQGLDPLNAESDPHPPRLGRSLHRLQVRLTPFRLTSSVPTVKGKRNGGAGEALAGQTYHATHPDSTARRARDAAPTLERAGVRWVGYGRTWAYTYPLSGSNLYSLEAQRQARALAAALGVPCRWKLEASRAGVLHVHLAAPLPPIAAPAGWTYARPVQDVKNYLRYLEKPGDARLCEQNRNEPWTHVDAWTYTRQYRDALDEQGAARRERLKAGKRRLPALSGWEGVEHRPAPLLPALLSALPALLWLCAALLTLNHLGRVELVDALRRAWKPKREPQFQMSRPAPVSPVGRPVPRRAPGRPGGDRAPPGPGAGPP